MTRTSKWTRYSIFYKAYLLLTKILVKMNCVKYDEPTGLHPASWDVVVLFCRFVDCVALALTAPYFECSMYCVV